MRPFLRRALAGASALTVLSAAFVFGAAPASAEHSSFCPQSSSTRLLTANNGAYKVWLYQPAGGTVYICFGGLNVARGVFVFETGLGGSLVPTVTPTTTHPDCTQWLHLQDPVDFQVEVGWQLGGNPYHVCLGQGDGKSIAVDVHTAIGSDLPDAHLYIDRWTTLGDSYCTYVAPGSDPCRNPWAYGDAIPIV